MLLTLAQRENPINVQSKMLNQNIWGKNRSNIQGNRVRHAIAMDGKGFNINNKKQFLIMGTNLLSKRAIWGNMYIPVTITNNPTIITGMHRNNWFSAPLISSRTS
jgi:hypothetical protein